MSGEIPSFQDLAVWRKAIDLVVRVYEVTKSYPPEEKFGLGQETRTTARSIAHNIAEGKMRSSTAEYRQFTGIARGSSGELHSQLILASRLGYLAPTTFDELAERVTEIGRMLRGLERALTRFPTPSSKPQE
jgi:four helix bundle protein